MQIHFVKLDDDSKELTSLDESEDSEEYGEIKEYFTDVEWKRIPKYMKNREKSRLELHEHQNEEIKKNNFGTYTRKKII